VNASGEAAQRIVHNACTGLKNMDELELREVTKKLEVLLKASVSVPAHMLSKREVASFSRYRDRLIRSDELRDLLPPILKDCRNLFDVGSYVMTQLGTNEVAEQQRFVSAALKPLYEKAEASFYLNSVGDRGAEAAEQLPAKRSSSRNSFPRKRKPATVFIGHGRSPIWRILKDYLSERLNLGWEEFNREPVAGIATTERLKSMLDRADFAFLVMTGEDEQPDGTLRARENVVHEAGLFQGRLGFARAIILAEDGCRTFSNLAGLTYIQFPKGNIQSCFEEIRRVLERERLIYVPVKYASK
jgi:predicted nucleotide-binding protein